MNSEQPSGSEQILDNQKFLITKFNCSKTINNWIIILLAYSIFSFVRNGLGFGLTTFGILWLLVVHHVNLRTIKEPPKTRYPYMPYSSLKLTIFSMFVILFLAITILLSFLFTWNIYVLRIRNLLIFTIAFILLPKYFINQNENLNLYVSVYHWVPAPVLPWQLPKNFNPNSVKLVCVNHP